MGIFTKKEKAVDEPQYYTSAINSTVLNYRVYVFSASEKLLYFILCLILGGAVGLIFYGGLFKQDGESTIATLISNLVVFFVFGAFGIKIILPIINERLKKKRIQTLKLQFREFLTALSNSMSGGMNVPDAMERAYEDLTSQYSDEAYISLEVKEILLGIQNNMRVEDMIAALGQRSGIEDINNFAIVFSTCYRTGGNISSIVRRTTDIISEKMVVSEEIQTSMASNKTQLNFMTILPIVLTFAMRMLSSDFAKSFSSILGVIIMTFAIVLFIAAYKYGQKIMDIKG